MAKDDYSALMASERFFAWSTGTRTRRGLTIQSHGEALVPQRVVKPEDAEGETPAAVPTFSEIVSENASQITGEVVLGLTTDELLLKVVELPAVEDEDLVGMVDLQADKFSPFPIDQMTFSHEVLSRTEDACTVLIAAAPTRYIERIGGDFAESGITCKRVDAVALGWWRLLNAKGKVDVEGQRFIFIVDRHYVEMIVLHMGVPRVFRTFRTTDDTSIAQDIAAEISLTLMTLELRGADSTSVRMSAWIEDECGASILVAIEAACRCEIARAPIAELGEVTDGLLHRHTEGVRLNLTPASWTAAREAQKLKKRLIGSTAGVLALWCLVVGGLLAYLYYEQSRLNTLVSKNQALSGPALEVRELRRRVFMVEQYMYREDSALACLAEIAALQPQGVELNSYSYRKKDGDVRISGFGLTVNQVYEFKTQLDASELFCDSELVGPRKTAQGETFEVRMTLCKVGQS